MNKKSFRELNAYQSSLMVVSVVAVVAMLGTGLFGRSQAATTYTISSGASLNSAIGRLQAGDTLIVGNGSYSGTVSASPSGTASAPITIKAAPGANPVLTGLVRLSSPNYVTWDNIDVKWPSGASSSDHMFKMTGGTGWRVTNSDIGGARSYAGMLVAGTPSKYRIDHNYFHDTFPSNSTNQDHLIYVNGGTGGGTIERNIFSNSANGRGVKIGPPSGGSSAIGNVTVRYNTFYNNTGPSNIQLSYGASGNIIYRNVMVKSGGANITAYNLNGSGNRAYENIGWDSSRVGEFGGGLSDGGGNQHVNPSLNTSTWQVASAYAGYGRYAPGDTGGTAPTPPPPAPTPTPTPPAPTPTPAPTPPPTGPAVPVTAGPYDDVQQAIPGKVELENFDEGVEGQAFHDSDATNQFGSTYRYGGVDVRDVAEASNGHVVSSGKPGEWTAYTVSIARAGTYKVSVHGGNTVAGGAFRLELDGNTLSSSLVTVPNTGSFSTMASSPTITVTLPAGVHMLRLWAVAAPGTTAADLGRTDYLMFTADTPAPPPAPTPGAPGDINGDGRVNAIDLGIIINFDGQNYPPADFNGDGTVGAADMAVLLSKWTW